MNHRKTHYSAQWLLTLTLCLLIFACQNANKDSTKNQPPSKVKSSKPANNAAAQTTDPADDFIVVGGKNVGPITANATEADLIKIYGEAHVKRDSLHVGEGFYTPSTVIFPDSPKALHIAWEEGQAFKKMARIVVKHPESAWKTQEGITIGSTLVDLIKANAVDFTFLGFDWDYAGSVANWEGGVLENKKMGMRLSPTRNDIYRQLTAKERGQIIGDLEVSSSNPVLKKLEVKVTQLFFYF